MVLCFCGCGEKVKPGNKYIHGHNRRGIHCSEPHKKKIGKANKLSLLGHKCSEETKRKIGLGNKGKTVSKETRKLISQNTKKQMSTKESKERTIKINKERIWTPETRKKVSISRKGHNDNKGQIPSVKCGRGKRSYHNSPYQNRICFRSSYEKGYAEFLDANHIDWLYEPMTFDLDDTTYLPDFYLIKSKRFIEIKGYMSKVAQRKIDLFRKLYSSEWLEVLFREDLIEMGVEI